MFTFDFSLILMASWRDFRMLDTITLANIPHHHVYHGLLCHDMHLIGWALQKQVLLISWKGYITHLASQNSTAGPLNSATQGERPYRKIFTDFLCETTPFYIPLAAW
jgi:hypothetical protein